MPQLRLDKIIADSGIASRSEAKILIRSGRVTVDGNVVLQPEAKLDGTAAAICIDGSPVDYAVFRYIMMNKPAGVLSACEDRHQKTVIDLLSPELQKQGLSPVGRLDKDTTGLLLLTNDGEFSHRITSPKKHMPKLYRAGVDTPMTPDDADAFASGITLADGTGCLPARLEKADNAGYTVLVTLYEGKFHQVKKMLASRGMKVLTLSRLSIGGLKLDPRLSPGEYRELTKAEANSIFG